MNEVEMMDANRTMELNPSMSEPWMVRHLGVWSSHPYYSARRLFVLFLMALLPWACTIAAVLIWLAADPDMSAGWILEHARRVLFWGLITAGFAAGLGLTGALAIIASRSHAIVADKGTPSIGLWGGFLFIFLLGSIPWIVPMLIDAGPRFRAFIALLGVLPFAAVVVLVLLAPTEDGRGRPLAVRLRWWTLLFPLAVLGALLWVRFGGVAVELAGWGPFPQILSKVFEASTLGPVDRWQIDPAARDWIITGLTALFLSPLFVLALMLMLWLRELVVVDSDERRVRNRKSVVERVKRRPLMGERQSRDPYKRRKLGFSKGASKPPSGGDPTGEETDAVEPEADGDRPPGWVAALQVAVDPELEMGDWVPKRFAVGETSPLYAGAESFDEFFAGVTPSTDQVRAFGLIYEQRAKSFDLERQHEPAWKNPAVDVLIQGCPGSGRTSTTIAVIVQSVIIRGETVLVLVPNATKRRSMIRRIRRAAESSGVGWFINVGDLTESGVQPWVEPNDDGQRGSQNGTTKAESDRVTTVSFSEAREQREKKSERDRLERSAVAPKSTPDVLVGTIEDYEERFFAGSSNFGRLQAVLRRIELVVVDDLNLFDVSDRVHLRFVLDKTRLIVGAEGLRCQTLLVTPTMGDAARDFVAEQLLTAKQRVETMMVRPFARAPGGDEPWEVQLRATTPGSIGVSRMIELCAKACLSSGVEVVIFSPRMSNRERRELESSLEATGDAAVRVVADLDELDVQDSSQFGAVFYSATNGMGASMAIRAHAGSDEVVVFTILPMRMEALDKPAKHDLLVLPDGRSRALFASHLRSAARFLRRLQPTHRALWSKFGLPQSGALREDLNSVDGRAATMLEDREVVLDPSDPVAARRPGTDLWGWCCLASDGGTGVGEESQPRPMPVRIRDMIESGTSIRVHPGAGRFGIAAIHDPVAAVHGLAERRVAEWFSEDRQSIGREDLAYCSTLRYESEESAFFPSAFEERDGRDRGAIRIEGALWSERADSSVTQSYMLSLRIVDFTIPSDFIHKRSSLTALPARVQLFESMLKPAPQSEVKDALSEIGERPNPLDSRQFVTLEVAATFDELGETRKQALKLRYEAATCFMTFDFTEADLESVAIQRDLGGAWGLGSDSPSLPRSIVPELGAAFTIAMRRHAPGMERLARCIGIRFDPVGGTPRFALVFIEPLSTDGTAARLLSRMIRDRAFLAEFIETATTALEDVQRGRVPGSSLFVRAQVCIGPSLNDDRTLAVNMDVVATLAMLLRDIANAAAKPARE